MSYVWRTFLNKRSHNLISKFLFRITFVHKAFVRQTILILSCNTGPTTEPTGQTDAIQSSFFRLFYLSAHQIGHFTTQ